MFGFLKSKSTKKAIVFVDYEYWFYSYKTLYGMRPNPKDLRTMLEKKYDIADIMVFGDFSSPGMDAEPGKLRNITNAIIETGNTFNRHKKDMTDFVMLDYIYQYDVQNPKVGTYIICTGDGHFQSVIKYLVQKKKKNVVVYGVRNSISRQLRDVATQVVQVPGEDELEKYYCNLIIKNMEAVRGNPRVTPTFMGTAETIAGRYQVNVDEIKAVLAKMLEQGYLYKKQKYMGKKKCVKMLAADWDKIREAGLYDTE